MKKILNILLMAAIVSTLCGCQKHDKEDFPGIEHEPDVEQTDDKSCTDNTGNTEEPKDSGVVTKMAEEIWKDGRATVDELYDIIKVSNPEMYEQYKETEKQYGLFSKDGTQLMSWPEVLCEGYFSGYYVSEEYMKNTEPAPDFNYLYSFFAAPFYFLLT